MGVSHGSSRITDLRFRVFDRALHPDWFAVREHRRVTQAHWEADVRVIEGGHSVVFRAGPVRLTEVVAGPETALPAPGLVYHSPLRQDRSASLDPGGGVNYQTCFQVERVDPEVFAHLTDEMTLDAARGRLFHRFAPADRLAAPPVSHVRYEANARGLTVHTFHSFPGERAIVRSQSLFERR